MRRVPAGAGCPAAVLRGRADLRWRGVEAAGLRAPRAGAGCSSVAVAPARAPFGLAVRRAAARRALARCGRVRP